LTSPQRARDIENVEAESMPIAAEQTATRQPDAPEEDFLSLRTEGVTKAYGGRRVVDRVSIEVRPGQIVGLLGPNGAGKTTTFNMVVGIIRPLEGRILLEGEDITRLPLHKRARRGLGYLPQETSVFRKLTVEENILAVLQVRGFSRREQRARLGMLYEELGIGHKAKQLAHTLSGGERRRVEIARALASEPRFMLLDEPFSGVDPKAVEEIQEIVHKMRDSGLGILITDHSVRETLAVTDHSYIIHEGRICVSGDAEKLVNDPEARRLYLGERFYMNLPESRRGGAGESSPAPGDRSEEG
jgi:lipopolysaccharide export system ATP-binding protein